MNDRFISFLGICKKAGKVSMGFDLVVDDIEKGRSNLVLITSDLSQNTKKKILLKCIAYNVDYIEIKNSIEEMYTFLGKGSGVISILDLKCSEKIKSLLNTNSVGGNN